MCDVCVYTVAVYLQQVAYCTSYLYLYSDISMQRTYVDIICVVLVLGIGYMLYMILEVCACMSMRVACNMHAGVRYAHGT